MLSASFVLDSPLATTLSLMATKPSRIQDGDTSHLMKLKSYSKKTVMRYKCDPKSLFLVMLAYRLHAVTHPLLGLLLELSSSGPFKLLPRELRALCPGDKTLSKRSGLDPLLTTNPM